jgi:hypothetical protein
MVAPVLRVNAPRILSDLIKYEVDPSYVREVATQGAGVELKIGTPVAFATAKPGVVVAWNPAASDGSEDCVGLSVVARPAPQADTAKGATYLARGATPEQRAAALVALAALGILSRPSF